MTADEQPTAESPQDSPPFPSPPPGVRVIAADDLLQGAREVWLRLGSEIYRLRLTRNGRLLLHK